MSASKEPEHLPSFSLSFVPSRGSTRKTTSYAKKRASLILSLDQDINKDKDHKTRNLNSNIPLQDTLHTNVNKTIEVHRLNPIVRRIGKNNASNNLE